MAHESPEDGWTVSAEEEGERLDRFLTDRVGGWSRSKLQGFIKEGLVTIDGRVERKSNTLLVEGESIGAELPERKPHASAAEVERQLEILFEDDDLLVVQKPAGLLTHRRENGREISLAELCEAHCGPLPSPQGEERPGIVHRLDRDTSGVMVIGKNEGAMTELLRQFREREVTKTYAVLVSGEPRFTSDWVESPLGRDPRRPDRISVLEEDLGGRPAATLYEVQERLAGFAYLHCKPKTGRTHQIRVHLTSVGMDVLGDKTYRVKTRRNPSLPNDSPPAHRQMLHALRLSLKHPSTGESVTFEAPPPSDFAALLDWLRKNSEEA